MKITDREKTGYLAGFVVILLALSASVIFSFMAHEPIPTEEERKQSLYIQSKFGYWGSGVR